VKVYVDGPTTIVFTAGDQAPVMPSFEVVGKTGATASLQTSAKAGKVGVGGVVTVRVFVVVNAHCPAEGVNVYVVVPITAVETAGDQVPVIPSFEVVGSTGAAVF
jgi:hypothetical protein